MADANGAPGEAAPLYESLYDASAWGGFALGDGDEGAGAAGDWERRRDAPTAMRIAIDGDGELAAPPAEHEPVRTAAPCHLFCLRHVR